MAIEHQLLPNKLSHQLVPNKLPEGISNINKLDIAQRNVDDLIFIHAEHRVHWLSTWNLHLMKTLALLEITHTVAKMFHEVQLPPLV
jgi:hypothetical protein